MPKHKTKYLYIIGIILIALGGLGYLLPNKKSNPPTTTACTMEAKICPDGSSVGRSGPNCEFAPCPVVELSGIKGVAMLGPICPVQKNPPEPQCADRPYKTTLSATNVDATSQVIKIFDSDEAGRFSVDLLPGEYNIASADTSKMFSRCSSNGPVKVEKNKYTEITLSCDTGIR